jgi:hypothetical protein
MIVAQACPSAMEWPDELRPTEEIYQRRKRFIRRMDNEPR